MLKREDAHTEVNVFVPCVCGREILNLSVFLDKDDDYPTVFISTYIDTFGAYQQTGWSIFKEKAKAIWYILIGKRFYLEELVLDGNALKEFCEDMKVFIEEVEKTR